MKKFKLKIVPLILCVTFIGCSEQQQVDKNAQNIKRIKIGMADKEVRSIMDELPYDSGTISVEPKQYYLLYQAPSLYSGDFIIYFSAKDSIVENIDNGL